MDDNNQIDIYRLEDDEGNPYPIKIRYDYLQNTYKAGKVYTDEFNDTYTGSFNESHLEELGDLLKDAEGFIITYKSRSLIP